MNLDLKRFDMKSISFKPNESKGPVVVLIGRRDTGKSFLVRDLLFYHQDIPIGTVISVRLPFASVIVNVTSVADFTQEIFVP